MSERKKMFPHDPDLQEEYELMNTKGVEDGIVCEFCGTHCYQGAEHNARVEDNARFDDPKPAAVPVEERTQVNHIWSGREKMPCGCSAKTEYPYYNAETGHVHCIACGRAFYHQSQIVPEERTAEMEKQFMKQNALDIQAILQEAIYPGQPLNNIYAHIRHALVYVKLQLDHIEGAAK